MQKKSPTKLTKDSKEILESHQEIQEFKEEAEKEVKEAKKDVKEAVQRAKKAETEKEELKNLLIQVIKAQDQSKIKDWLNILCWIVCFALLIIQALNR